MSFSSLLTTIAAVSLLAQTLGFQLSLVNHNCRAIATTRTKSVDRSRSSALCVGSTNPYPNRARSSALFVGSIDIDEQDPVIPVPTTQQLNVDSIQEVFKGSFPFIIPFVAFFSFEKSNELVHWTVETIQQDLKWEMVDGGAYQAALLVPIINGIVLPALSITLGTLVALTVTTLRTRQLNLRTCLNNELSDIRSLYSCINGVYNVGPGPAAQVQEGLSAAVAGEDTWQLEAEMAKRDRARDATHDQTFVEMRATRTRLLTMLTLYLSRVYGESVAKRTADITPTSNTSGLDSLGLESPTDELGLDEFGLDRDLSLTLDYLSIMSSELHDITGTLVLHAKPEAQGGLGLDTSSCQDIVQQLNRYRSERLAALGTIFPTVHWTVLSVLAGSVVVCFLLESDQETILFLDNIQLRILFTMLMGGIGSTALLMLDLLYPFRATSTIVLEINALRKAMRKHLGLKD